ncbi:MAG: hypothetical protein N2746_07980 [Deltaproteobacteria bacterium]|nr:hypothetical protein [Deltaproteobacteria bacterium]
MKRFVVLVLVLALMIGCASQKAAAPATPETPKTETPATTTPTTPEAQTPSTPAPANPGPTGQ